MVNVTYLVHVGYHLDRHVIASPGMDAMTMYGMSCTDLPGDNWKPSAVEKGRNG